MTQQLPKPFLGRMLLEAMDDDVENYMREKAGVAKDSKIILPDDYKQKHAVPIKKGKVIDMAPDAYGEAFINKYGNVGEIPTVGSTVMFIPGQSYKVDLEGKYIMIGDEDVIAFYRGE